MDRRNPLYVAFTRYKFRQNKPISTLYSRYLLMYCTAGFRENVNKHSANQDCTNFHCKLNKRRMYVTSLLCDLAAPLVFILRTNYILLCSAVSTVYSFLQYSIIYVF